MDNLTESISSDLEKIKTAQFCVSDNNCGIFVLEDGEQVEICGRDLLIALCLLLDVEIRTG